MKKLPVVRWTTLDASQERRLVAAHKQSKKVGLLLGTREHLGVREIHEFLGEA